MVECFLGIFGYPKGAKVKKHLKTGGKRWANMERCVAVFLVALGAYWGLIWECLGASLQVVRYPTKIAPFPLFGAIAFPRSFQISVLRAF